MKKKILLSALGVLLLLCAIGAVLVWTDRQTERERPVTETEQRVSEQVSAAYTADLAPSNPTSTPEPDAAAEETPYESPVDFETLRAVNDEIYAWLYIPGTEINSPLLQSAEDDEYYLRHNIEGARDTKGALFTQKTYNGTDFSDPVTVIYGHNMESGTMFGHMQALYSGSGALETYQDLIVYLPDREMHYKVFAATPSGKLHILYYYDFSNPVQYQTFLDMISDTRVVGAQRNQEIEVTPEDQMVILSTCLKGDSEKRYLVLAVRCEDSLQADLPGSE